MHRCVLEYRRFHLSSPQKTIDSPQFVFEIALSDVPLVYIIPSFIPPCKSRIYPPVTGESSTLIKL